MNEQRRTLEHEYFRDMVELLEVLKQRFGNEVVDVVDDVVKERKLREWRDIAQSSESNSLANLVRTLWPPQQRERGYEFTVERNTGRIQVVCTKCPVHELAKELHATDWVNHLVCKGDPYIVEGFNPKLGFEHVKSLMKGEECCKQVYFEKDKQASL